jgi:hypothetical protein
MSIAGEVSLNLQTPLIVTELPNLRQATLCIHTERNLNLNMFASSLKMFKQLPTISLLKDNVESRNGKYSCDTKLLVIQYFHFATMFLTFTILLPINTANNLLYAIFMHCII